MNIYLIVINCCLGSLFFGYEMGIYNSCQDLIAREYDLKPDVKVTIEGMITSTIPLGAIIGALVSSYVLKSGRRFGLLICDSISFLGVILTLIHGKAPLLVGRLLCGIGVGNKESLQKKYKFI